jgi:hypothetical protein
MGHDEGMGLREGGTERREGRQEGGRATEGVGEGERERENTGCGRQLNGDRHAFCMSHTSVLGTPERQAANM